VRCRSRPLEHLFGWPYQLGTHAAADSTSDADEFEFTLRIGDVLLVGTDGLWDNLHEWEIAEEAENSISRGAAAIARSLASRAYESSLDQDRVTPYSIAASNAFEMVYSGGKRDDIAVVCALAREE
jgi:protein phosphatase PTC7